MQYILNETEFQAYLQLQEAARLKTIANMALEEEVENLRKSRETDRETILANRERRKELRERLEATQELLKNSREHVALCNKQLAEKAHELLVKDAELANLSSQVQSLVKENQTYCNIIAEMKRDCEGTSTRLTEAEKISVTRLEVMNNLLREVRRLKAEHVCIATNPQNGHVKVISAAKADAFREFGWTVSEECLVDRPA